MNFPVLEQNKKNTTIVNILSFAIPLAVALLIGIRQKIDLGLWTKSLPCIIAFVNGTTAVLLLMGLYFIKTKNIKGHRAMMSGAFVLGALFLVLYILYHISNQSTKFGDDGNIKYVYYFFLLSHILLSILVVRFVLQAMYFALSNKIDLHKKVVAIAYPVWLYVSVTGVIVYFMIKPFYQ
ncbi:MAG: DUF420 domain-containing protein [Pseudarcicella sp.]|nr:DUF420 domain-containing protein [Pseudarcicella sp.]MBP6411105.1 DUF420 domain-containing protein [Pseudarcicella sp.]